jgi:hypothetical protein
MVDLRAIHSSESPVVSLPNTKVQSIVLDVDMQLTKDTYQVFRLYTTSTRNAV